MPHVGQKMLTLSGTPDFTHIGEFMISLIHYKPLKKSCIYSVWWPISAQYSIFPPQVLYYYGSLVILFFIHAKIMTCDMLCILNDGAGNRVGVITEKCLNGIYQ